MMQFLMKIDAEALWETWLWPLVGLVALLLVVLLWRAYLRLGKVYGWRSPKTEKRLGVRRGAAFSEVLEFRNEDLPPSDQWKRLKDREL